MLYIYFFLFSHMFGTSTSLNSLAVNHSIQDSETLVSAGGITELGFFSLRNSTRRYLAIWFRNVSPLTVVWVANRNTPLQNNSGLLKLNENGIVVLLNATNSTIWSSNISSKEVNDPTAHLLDSGNFVVKNGHETKESILWQSFDYPGDTHMPEMKIGWNLETGLERYITSWRSVDDPAEGEYSIKIDLKGYPQVMMYKGSGIVSRGGPWNGIILVGNPGPIRETLPKFVLNDKEVYFEYMLLDRSVFFIYKLTPLGTGQRLFWTNQTSSWHIVSTGHQDQCENYGFCGANSVCNYDGNHPTCECLRGYVPNSPAKWNMSVWFRDCVPRNKSNCKSSDTDGFLRYTHMKLPDTSSSWFNETMSLDECQKTCLKNCSCTAYANLDIRDEGSGCLLWFNNIVDLRKFSQWGQDLYIRVPASELDHGSHGIIMKKIVGITVGVTIFGLIITCVYMMIIKNSVAARIYRHIAQFQRPQEYFMLKKEDTDLPRFEFSIIAEATNNFSSRNKLGEGGFGPVYKGTLVDGQEVAVKRKSVMSDQGLEEFKNEVVLIAKLQHRNLVKLLGYCIKGEEKLLIYEYMANKSLDYIIFDDARKKLLAWHQRFHIIRGIARGLLYLHQDSRLRIIHRDLKTSNILLDVQMNPKIADFGLARTFGSDQIEAKTRKVVGTYGYMPPEYAVHGHYSVKSDVFGFGVIVLEIVNGNKNRGFSDPAHSLNLLGHAWRLWTEDRPLELIDTHLCERCIPFEVLRCIHVGLLCVQKKPEDRPDMASVIPMLNGEKLLPQPKLPGFYTGRCTPESISSSRTCNLLSRNEMSLTAFMPRENMMKTQVIDVFTS